MMVILHGDLDNSDGGKACGSNDDIFNGGHDNHG